MTLYLHRYGHGAEALFGIHGWGADHSTFATLAEHFEPEAVSLWACDLPGYGRSAPPASYRSLDAVVDPMLASLATIEAEQLTLIGSCSGAIPALEIARRAPDRVAALVLLEPFAYMPWYLKLFLAPVLGPIAYWSTFANPLGRALTNRRLAREQVAASATESFAALDPRVPYRYLQLLGELTTTTRWAELEVPIRIICGERTFGAIHASRAIWLEQWPQAQGVVLPGVGHLLIQEAPGALARAIVEPPLRALAA